MKKKKKKSTSTVAGFLFKVRVKRIFSLTEFKSRSGRSN